MRFSERGLKGGRPEGTGALTAASASAAAEGADAPRLHVGVSRRADRTTVHPHGDLDLVSAPALQAALDGVVDARRVVLDLSGVSFVDSAAVHLLVDVDRRARRDGFELSLVPPAPPADLAIELCGLYETLPFTSAPDG